MVEMMAASSGSLYDMAAGLRADATKTYVDMQIVGSYLKGSLK